ncbi:VUT family protein [Paracoccus sp. P2]|uniref:Probable queuosine precursor transporter n=1 Tax=Paracoccus pantotrophus TaxID=82367 RepID=A0A7H9C024_PARPN|nr:VUT family protein [Paracoccus pantotrophus]MDF3852735.1 VUT family protein [Paracoccus pantotrophus]QLH16346.1 VUT family protein [Paracoccus pantotrophus]RDD97181.1 VUT family protein [Paracoccus pantotrophus]RNI18462.1 VUT family protein [Paracoccus pantotrophus]WGR64377.1 VUT family protein [Paracoccus pantotrophus]
MSRILPGVIAMAAVVVASNILVQHLLGAWLTWGALTYPVAFLVTDIMNRVYGPAAARKVVYAGFVTGVLCSVVAAGLDKTTLRIAIASGAAFLSAQLMDISVFNQLRKYNWWLPPLAASVAGSILDTAVFFSIAFAAQLTPIFPADDVSWANELVPLLGHGPVQPLWVSLAVADCGVKLAQAVLALVPFRIVVGNLIQRRAQIH